MKHMHEDLEMLKRDMAVIKHVLLQEHKLTPRALKDLEKARKTSQKEYISQEDLRKQLLR